MSDLFKNPRKARITGLTLAVILVALAVFNFYEFARSPTDENLFTDVPSNLMIISNLPSPQQNRDAGVEKGDLLLEINGKELESALELNILIQNIQPDSLVKIKIFRPRLNASQDVLLLKSYIPDSIIFRIPSAVRVIQVLEGGASDRAGMKVGDLIYQIDGRDFKNSFEADYIMRQSRKDKSIVYNIYRQGDPLVLHVKMAIAGFRSARILLLICGLIYIILGLLLLWFRPQYKAARVLGFTGIFIGFYFAVVFSTIFINLTFQGGVRFALIYSAIFIGYLYEVRAEANMRKISHSR